MRKKESAADKSQKLMLTWLVTYPTIFDTVEKYLSPSDFVPGKWSDPDMTQSVHSQYPNIGDGS